ncbi:MAG: hypothetical protein MJ241_00490 [Bacilli bacterium]|nr:hypothetical protein [Bacilli bacterium]
MTEFGISVHFGELRKGSRADPLRQWQGGPTIRSINHQRKPRGGRKIDVNRMRQV